MAVSTWVAYLDLGDDVVLPIAESGKQDSQFSKFRRRVTKEVGHEDFEILTRENITERYPDAIRDYDERRRSGDDERIGQGTESEEGRPLAGTG